MQIMRYLRLFWRAKWYIALAVPFGFALALIILIKVMAADPDLPATVLIGIENAADMTAFKDLDAMPEGRADLITSRNFLEGIVVGFSLRLRLGACMRGEVFDSVFVDSEAPNGRYSFLLDKSDKNSYTIFFRNARSFPVPFAGRLLANSGAVVDRGKLADLKEIRVSGIRLHMAPVFLNNPHDFSFTVIDMRSAIELLYKSITIKPIDPRKGAYNLPVSVQGRDYVLITDIVNGIADAFVRKNAEYRKARSRTVLSAVDKQLQMTKEEYETAENRLRGFRTANPTVGLTQDAQQAVESITSLQSGIFQQQSQVEDAKVLQAKYNRDSEEERSRAAEEMLVFLASKGVTAAPVLQQELATAAAAQKNLQANYAPDHPLMQENTAQLRKIREEIRAALTAFVTNAAGAISQNGATIQTMTSRLQNLPGKELQLAELQRDQQIASNLFATVLNRYNQAKAADIVDIPDVYVLDYAVRPIPPPFNMMKILAMAIAIAMGLAFAPVLALDYFDPTARTEFDLRRKTRLTPLEILPVFSSAKGKGSSESMTGRASAAPGKQSALVTEEETRPAYTGEIFRSLATKMLLKYYDSPEKTVVITSMESGAGKSTIASNLAASLARQGLLVLLVDADMRCGVQHSIFNVPRGPGLSDLLSSGRRIDTIDISDYAKTTRINGLLLIPTGSETPDPAQFLGLPLFNDFVKHVAHRFDLCIFDTPPMGPVSDAIIVGAHCTGIIVTALAGKTRINDIAGKIAEFPEINKKILGVVLNRATVEGKAPYYKTSRYYSRTGAARQNEKGPGKDHLKVTIR